MTLLSCRPFSDGLTALAVALRDASRAAEALTAALVKIEAAVAVIITTTAADAAPEVASDAPTRQDLAVQGEEPV